MYCPRLNHFVRLNQDGSIGKCGHMKSAPGFANFKQLDDSAWLQNVKDEDPKFAERIQSGTNKYIQFIYNNFDKYGLNQYALVSGFVGLVLADMIDPWVTFVGEK